MIKYLITSFILVSMCLVFMCAEVLAQCNDCPENEAAQNAGSIRGKVLDATGKPVIEAKVYAQPLEQSLNGRVPTTYTDKEGKFFLKAVSPGQHLIHACKEDEGYPDTFFGFFIDNPKSIPEVSVAAKQVTDNIIIQLGTKWRRLFGQIIDATNGKAVKNAKIILYRADNPDIWFSTQPKDQDAKFQILVPNTFKIQVTAPGYKDWYYGGATSKENAITYQMNTVTEQQMKIVLTP